jgi:hypothetical protein
VNSTPELQRSAGREKVRARIFLGSTGAMSQDRVVRPNRHLQYLMSAKKVPLWPSVQYQRFRDETLSIKLALVETIWEQFQYVYNEATRFATRVGVVLWSSLLRSNVRRCRYCRNECPVSMSTGIGSSLLVVGPTHTGSSKGRVRTADGTTPVPASSGLTRPNLGRHGTVGLADRLDAGAQGRCLQPALASTPSDANARR